MSVAALNGAGKSGRTGEVGLVGEGWKQEKRLCGVVGVSRNDLRAWRDGHLAEGTDWVADRQRVIWWSAGAIERLVTELAKRAAGNVQGPGTNDRVNPSPRPSPLLGEGGTITDPARLLPWGEEGVAVRCRVVRGYSLPNRRVIEVLVLEGRWMMRRVTVRVRSNENFGTGMEVLAARAAAPGGAGSGSWEFRGRPAGKNGAHVVGRVVYPRARGRW